MGAVLGAFAAADALFLVHEGLAVGVHIPLALVGAAAHAQILQSAAEAGFLMPLEVVQGDDDVGIHDGSADPGGLGVLAAFHGDRYIVGALQTVGDQHMAAGGEGGEAVEVCGFQMIQSVLPGAYIHGVGVGEEGLASQILHQIHDDLGVVGADVGQVAQFTEVDLDGNELVFEIDLVEAGGHDQPSQLLGQGF